MMSDDTNLVEVDNTSKSEDGNTKSGRVSIHNEDKTPERSSKEDQSLANNYGEDRLNKGNQNNEIRQLFGTSNFSMGENNKGDTEQEIKKGPDLIEDGEDVIQHRRETEEDEDMEYNIQQISKAGDLSPRHTNSIKHGARKGNKEQ
ncbi:hypothetical protein R3W88_000167 [Solanum pinnatisectum]|uniref:Uncharacterized protein n=1 Tax=Solanum pinnatisectum TaxID=50273 RepID=A0AAV9MHA1_9SOLN|nr:hypothetical protein R3W88_000167 [Solanum pinnatisectum]